MDNREINGLLLIDCEPSRGASFILRKEIREHLGKGKVGDIVMLSNVDKDSLSRIEEAMQYMTASQKRTFMNYKIVYSNNGFIIKDKNIVITNGDFSIKKLKFKRDANGNIKEAVGLATKKMDRSNIETILKTIYKEYSSEKNFPLAGTNVAYDISHLKFMLTVAYSISAENIEKSDFIKYMGMINNMETRDIRHSFISTILKKEVSADSMDSNIHREKYIDYCISNGFITRNLNLITTQEVMHNFSQEIENQIGFVKQTHTSDQDVAELATLIQNKISMLYKANIQLEFNGDSKKVEISSYNNISLKDMKKRLMDEGYLIYEGNLKQIENLTDADIDSIKYIPSRPYYNDPPELIRIITVDMKTPKGDPLEYFKMLFKKMTQVRKSKTLSEKYQHGIVSGITKITLDTLIEADIKAYGKISDERRVGRVKFILYYFLEQQKAIEMMKALNAIYGDRRSLSLPNSVVSYSKLIELLNTPKLMGIFKEKIKDSDSKIDIKEVVKRYTFALSRAIETEMLEYKAGLVMTKASSADNDEETRKGGVYYEQKRTDIADSSIVGYDSILWSNGNGLSLYFGFFPGKSFLYVSFKRNKGAGYKSYLYNGLDYKYYQNILNSVIANSSIGKAVWRLLREVRTAIQHRTVVKAEKGKINKKSKYFEDVSGEEGVYRKDEEAEGIDFGLNADEQNSKMTEEDAQVIAGTLYVKAFFQEASTIKKR